MKLVCPCMCVLLINTPCVYLFWCNNIHVCVSTHSIDESRPVRILPYRKIDCKFILPISIVPSEQQNKYVSYMVPVGHLYWLQDALDHTIIIYTDSQVVFIGFVGRSISVEWLAEVCVDEYSMYVIILFFCYCNIYIYYYSIRYTQDAYLYNVHITFIIVKQPVSDSVMCLFDWLLCMSNFAQGNCSHWLAICTC